MPKSNEHSGKSFFDRFISKLPYTYMVNNIDDNNPKYDIFNELTKRKEERLIQQSVVSQDKAIDGTIAINKDYQRFMYSNIDADKSRRLHEYRRMASYSEISDAIDEICDEVIVKDEMGNIVTLDVIGGYNDNIRKELIKEWNRFITVFKLEDNGWTYFRQFLIDGELFFENVISSTKPHYGILGVVTIPSEIINPIYDNIHNNIIKSFLLKDTTNNPNPNDNKSVIFLDKNQVTYINSGLWNEDRTMRIPFIEKSRRAYKQLSLIEDSIVIYRLVRAPERLAFYVDTGHMNNTESEQYLQKLMRQFWSKKTYNSNTKSVQNVFDPQSMLDSFWFTKRPGQDGTKVELLQGGANLGKLDDLMYFVKKLYKSLKVPIGRLNPEDSFKDGTDITREELSFAKFIMRLQRQFAMALKDSFIVHLKLRGLWQQYKIKEHNLCITFNTPTQFMIMRQHQEFNLKFENYNNMGNNELVSQSYAQRHYLGWTDDQMAENREWMRKDNELMWEIEQIRTNGPNYRQNQSDLEDAVDSISGSTPSIGAAKSELTQKTDNPPEFGPGPDIKQPNTEEQPQNSNQNNIENT